MPDEKRKQLLQKLQSLPEMSPSSESPDAPIPISPEKPPAGAPPGAPSEGTAVDSSSNAESKLDNMISEIMNELKQQGIDLKQILKETQKEAQETTEDLNNVRRIFGRSAGKEPGTLTFLSELANEILRKKVNMKIIEVAGKIIDRMPLFVKIKKERDTHGDELAGYRLTKILLTLLMLLL